ncbi:MAG: membrane protein insertase YidC [Puniceicoccales bacterium]|jgi:YidC/Oxa1 family membrane protein insertase|nr:membrane protein insertase YidC [Puniceicoccales bacterium]
MNRRHIATLLTLIATLLTPPDAFPQSVPPPAARTTFLENDHLRLDISLNGGAIRTAALRRHADTLAHRKDPAAHPYLFNTDGVLPALALSIDDTRGTPVEWALPFAIVENHPRQRLVLAARLTNGVTITRTYTLTSDSSKRDPHVIDVKTTFRAGDTPAPALTLRLNTGTLPPVEGDTQHQFLGIATYDGSDFSKTSLSEFIASSGTLGIGAHEAKAFDLRQRGEKPWQWISVTNQYFAGILRLDEPTRHLAVNLRVSPLYKRTPAGTPQAYTATGDIAFALPPLAPHAEITLGAEYYVGPREYSRLAALGGGQEKAVQFAKLFWIISVDLLCKLFVITLDWLHTLLPEIAGAWGLAIISLTIIIKALTWPLVTKQQRSAERMRQFQGPMKALREKHKNDPKRLQQEMMNLYREHRINPFAGCLPVLIQIPIFTGLFFTFQSLAQLRFQSFLWIPDLSMPDIIPGLEHIAGIPLHILPLFMGVTMWLNMRLTPMPNVEGQQKIIFYGMMLLFPILCYAMPAALMLYYSVQNILSIFQTLILRRRYHTQPTPTPAALPQTHVHKSKKRR